MSRIGKLLINIPSGVNVELQDQEIIVKGTHGELTHQIPKEILVSIKESSIQITKVSDSRIARQKHGLTRSLINNMVIGLSNGFKKTLELVGVGYRVQKSKDHLILHLGYSHPIEYKVLGAVNVELNGTTGITLSSYDKHLLGKVASEIRAFRPPEPYKGKGIKYMDEVIIKKAGKAGKVGK